MRNMAEGPSCVQHSISQVGLALRSSLRPVENERQTAGSRSTPGNSQTLPTPDLEVGGYANYAAITPAHEVSYLSQERVAALCQMCRIHLVFPVRAARGKYNPKRKTGGAVARVVLVGHDGHKLPLRVERLPVISRVRIGGLHVCEESVGLVHPIAAVPWHDREHESLHSKQSGTGAARVEHDRPRRAGWEKYTNEKMCGRTKD